MDSWVPIKARQAAEGPSVQTQRFGASLAQGVHTLWDLGVVAAVGPRACGADVSDLGSRVSAPTFPKRPAPNDGAQQQIGWSGIIHQS